LPLFPEAARHLRPAVSRVGVAGLEAICLMQPPFVRVGHGLARERPPTGPLPSRIFTGPPNSRVFPMRGAAGRVVGAW
jgi:hypothetical protein